MKTASRMSAEILRMLSEHATPGPWDAFGGHVSSLGVAPDGVADKYSRSDADSHEYYGGELICESCGHADAVFIAAMRNMVPDLVSAHLAALEQIAKLQQDVRYARLEIAEAREMTDLIRSRRYARPEYPLMRVRRGDSPAWSGVGAWSDGGRP